MSKRNSRRSGTRRKPSDSDILPMIQDLATNQIKKAAYLLDPKDSTPTPPNTPSLVTHCTVLEMAPRYEDGEKKAHRFDAKKFLSLDDDTTPILEVFNTAERARAYLAFLATEITLEMAQVSTPHKAMVVIQPGVSHGNNTHLKQDLLKRDDVARSILLFLAGAVRMPTWPKPRGVVAGRAAVTFPVVFKSRAAFKSPKNVAWCILDRARLRFFWIRELFRELVGQPPHVPDHPLIPSEAYLQTQGCFEDARACTIFRVVMRRLIQETALAVVFLHKLDHVATLLETILDHILQDHEYPYHKIVPAGDLVGFKRRFVSAAIEGSALLREWVLALVQKKGEEKRVTGKRKANDENKPPTPMKQTKLTDTPQPKLTRRYTNESDDEYSSDSDSDFEMEEEGGDQEEEDADDDEEAKREEEDDDDDEEEDDDEDFEEDEVLGEEDEDDGEMEVMKSGLKLIESHGFQVVKEEKAAITVHNQHKSFRELVSDQTILVLRFATYLSHPHLEPARSALTEGLSNVAGFEPAPSFMVGEGWWAWGASGTFLLSTFRLDGNPRVCTASSVESFVGPKSKVANPNNYTVRGQVVVFVSSRDELLTTVRGIAATSNAACAEADFDRASRIVG